MTDLKQILETHDFKLRKSATNIEFDLPDIEGSNLSSTLYIDLEKNWEKYEGSKSMQGISIYVKGEECYIALDFVVKSLASYIDYWKKDLAPEISTIKFNEIPSAGSVIKYQLSSQDVAVWLNAVRFECMGLFPLGSYTRGSNVFIAHSDHMSAQTLTEYLTQLPKKLEQNTPPIREKIHEKVMDLLHYVKG